MIATKDTTADTTAATSKPATPKSKVLPKAVVAKRKEPEAATEVAKSTPIATQHVPLTPATQPVAEAKTTSAAVKPLVAKAKGEKMDESALRAKLMAKTAKPTAAVTAPAASAADATPKTAEGKLPMPTAAAAGSASKETSLNPFAQSFDHLPPAAAQDTDAPAAKKVKATPLAQPKKTVVVSAPGAKGAKPSM